MNRLISIRLFLIFVLATSTTVAQVAPSPTPPQLKTLKLRYESDLQTARQLLRARYTSALDTLVISITKSGNLDGAVAVQHESNTVKGKAGAVSTNVQVPEMNTLKSRYEADLQTASDTLQTRYITALTALQETFTKRGDLAGALAVRQEVAAAKAGGGAIALPASAQQTAPLIENPKIGTIAPQRRISLQSWKRRSLYLQHGDWLTWLRPPISDELRANATFELVPGLGDKTAVSFRSVNVANSFLAHGGFRLRLIRQEDNDHFRDNATFKQVLALSGSSGVSFESLNFPKFYIRAKGEELFIEKSNGTLEFRDDATFVITDALLAR